MTRGESNGQCFRGFICPAKELGLYFLGPRVWGIRNAGRIINKMRQTVMVAE